MADQTSDDEWNEDAFLTDTMQRFSTSYSQCVALAGNIYQMSVDYEKRHPAADIRAILTALREINIKAIDENARIMAVVQVAMENRIMQSHGPVHAALFRAKKTQTIKGQEIWDLLEATAAGQSGNLQ